MLNKGKEKKGSTGYANEKKNGVDVPVFIGPFNTLGRYF
jgi:hypothetical protein